MTDDKGAVEKGPDDGAPADANVSDPDEDLIESDPPSPRESELRRRLELLVPLTVGRKQLGGMLIAALALGLVAGLVLGKSAKHADVDQATTQGDAQSVPPNSVVTIIPSESMDAQRTVYWSTATLLTTTDLAGLGEIALPGSQALDIAPSLAGLCGIPSTVDVISMPTGPGPSVVVLTSSIGNGVTALRLAGATMVERVGPFLDELSASAQLHGAVELARSCPSSAGLTVSTEGVRTEIGDEYAVLTVSRPDPDSGLLETSIVVLVRVGGQLLEITLTPEGGTDVSDGVPRAMAIAEVAVARMLTG